ncbi:hypothetical protein ZWY2020_024206 [Hordeum vulgare]|nr:hypothetical protein ZWY2020_024206 [Hordeum vulgare]
MAKGRNKNKAKNGAGGAAMDTSEAAPAASTAAEAPQPMDTSEGKQPSSSSAALSSINRKIKKGVQTKRTKNMRKMKAVARAISKTEKSEEKVLKAKSKKSRIQSAKSLMFQPDKYPGLDDFYEQKHRAVLVERGEVPPLLRLRGHNPNESLLYDPRQLERILTMALSMTEWARSYGDVSTIVTWYLVVPQAQKRTGLLEVLCRRSPIDVTH